MINHVNNQALINGKIMFICVHHLSTASANGIIWQLAQNVKKKFYIINTYSEQKSEESCIQYT